jgi:hypothetical protein
MSANHQFCLEQRQLMVELKRLHAETTAKLDALLSASSIGP